jgi:hypothetical protein
MSSAVPISASRPRRHRDPPVLWQAVLISSLVLHLAALFTLRRFQVEIVATKPAADPVPVEMIDLSAPAGTDATVQATTLTAPNPAAAPPPAANNPTSAAAPAERAIAPPVPATPEPVEPATIPPPQAASRPAPSPTPPTAPLTGTPTTPAPTAKPATPNNQSPVPPSSPIQSGEKIPKPSDGPSPGTAPGAEVPGEPPEPKLPKVVVSGETARNWHGIAATLGEVRSADGGKTINRVLPKPKQSEQVLELPNIPELTSASGKLITVRAVIDAKGQPDAQTLAVTVSSGFLRVDQMAKDAIKKFEFEPGHDSINTLNTPVDTLVEIDVKITPAP